jgi:16S rRNA (adenine1518-N6/adenine1519-N6)-dimethyltransferase
MFLAGECFMNIHPKKSLGQNFLKDRHYLQKIVTAARVGPEDQILEIGPGLGHLTQALAQRAKKVLALELDERLIPILHKLFNECPNVEIVRSDALEYPYGSLAGRWKVVANLPYYISTPIIQKFIFHRSRFTSLTLTLQKEVAERISALPGGKEYGYLSVLVQLYTEPRMEFIVPSGAFSPKPEVDSAVITLAVRDHPAITLNDEAFFVRVIKAAFSQRRKTLRNSLKQLGVSKEKMDGVKNETGVDLGRRAETLSVEEYGRLAESLHGKA